MQHMSCFKTFSKLGYHILADYAFLAVILHEIHDATWFGEWAKHNGEDYFYTDDTIGCGYDDRKVGPCIQFLVGGSPLQGRIRSKAYSAQHCVLKVSTVKTVYGYRLNIDMREVDKKKIRLFAMAFNGHFEKTICSNSNSDAPNEYLNIVGNAIFKYMDVVAGVAKERVDITYNHAFPFEQ